MEAPPLLLERQPGAQIGLAVGGPVVLGALCGWLLGVNETAYLVVSLLAIVGGIGSGYEHPDGDEGSVRGFCGGIIFGAMILATNAVIGAEPEAHLPSPPVVLVVLTTILGMLFGALGGWLRKRHDRREARSN
jgi:peptidoglycan/LPS O-acetylase OafA/YrhL